MMKRCICVGAAGLLLAVVLALPASGAVNLFTNPGFEDGLNGWIAFGNAYPETSNPPEIVPLEGNGEAKIFGNWSGGFNVTGFFQEFAATPGSPWKLSVASRHWSGDAMTQDGVDDNWVVQKLAFKDAGDAEIGAVESTILDGTFATDVWHENEPVVGIAPAGTVQVEAFVLYLQPLFDGGAAHLLMLSLALGSILAFRRRTR
jgi:hypothetical protein